MLLRISNKLQTSSNGNINVLYDIIITLGNSRCFATTILQKTQNSEY